MVEAGTQSAEENAGIELPICILHGSSSGNFNKKSERNMAISTGNSCGSESSLDTLSWESNSPSINDDINSQVSVDVPMSEYAEKSEENLESSSRMMKCDCTVSAAIKNARESQGQSSKIIDESTTPKRESFFRESKKSVDRDSIETLKPGVALGGIILGGVVLAAVGEELEEDVSNNSGDEASEQEPDVIERDTIGPETLPEFKGDAQISGQRPSMYLKRYYDIMYYCGIIAYNIGRKGQEEGCSLQKLRSSIQKFAFWMRSIMSAFDSFFRVKYNFFLAVSNDSDVEYSTFVYMAFHLAALVAKLYVLFLFFFNENKTDKMVQSMENFEGMYHSIDTSSRASWKIKLVYILALSTLAMTGSKRLLVATKYGVKDMILKASQELSDDLLTRNPEPAQNETDLMDTDQEGNITSSNIVLGFTYILRTAARDLQVGMIFYLVIVVCIVMNICVSKFMEEIKEITENVPRQNLEKWNKLQVKRELVWKKYRMLKLIVADVNDIFDPLFKLLHIRNLLSYAFFMAHIFFRSFSWILFMFFAINLVKAEVGYYIAGNIAELNDAIRTWIQNWAEKTGKFVVDGEEMDAGIQLDKLSVEPIGFGKGIFLIHQTFHYKFMGLVGSVFFSMAAEENKA